VLCEGYLSKEKNVYSTTRFIIFDVASCAKLEIFTFVFLFKGRASKILCGQC